MIFITARFEVRADDADDWPDIVGSFTRDTRAEPGCLWFDWFRSVEEPNVYVLVEAFRDDEAGAAHVRSRHFAEARRSLPPHLARTPDIVNFNVAQDGWSELGELAVDRST
jgi:quinol monooxygenase YgiN